MKASAKLLTGLAAALVAGWAWHGPAGQGGAFANKLAGAAQQRVAMTELPAIAVAPERDPLSRRMVVSGPANDLQRDGLGSQWGVKDYAASIDGVSGVRWDDEEAGFTLPLLAEILILCAIAYFVGFGLGKLVFGRRRRTSFLD